MTTKEDVFPQIITRESVTLIANDGIENGHSKLVDGDQVKFEADKICGLESDMISSLFSRTIRVHLTNIESKILEEVVEFCHRRGSIKLLVGKEQSAQQILQKIDAKFLMDHCSSMPDVTKYLRAACELEIKSLLNLTSTRIVNHAPTNGYSDHAILKMFHLKESFTVKEMNEHLQKMSFLNGRN